MADLSDVSAALVTLIAATLYPLGTAQPSVAGVGVKVFPGWPVPQQQVLDLAAGVCNVSVYPRAEERNTTRYPKSWQQLSVNTPTLTLTVAGQTVTVGGTIPPAINPHNAVIFANYKPYVYAVKSTDTLGGIAAALAALILVDVAGTTASGAVITLPSSARIGAVRIGITGTSAQELRRQERVFQITIWADTPTHRDAIAAPIDAALTALSFITLVDGFAARLIYKGSPMTDGLEKSGVFRRDLLYTIEYATTKVETDTQVTETQLNVSAAVAGVLPYQPVTTIYD